MSAKSESGELGALRSNDAGRLRFETVDDAVNYARKVTDAIQSRMPRKRPCIVEHYVKGNIEIVLDVSMRTSVTNGELVIGLIPNGWDTNMNNAATADIISPKFGDDSFYLTTDLVLISTSGLPQIGKKIIASHIPFPSWVRFERKKQRVEFWRDVLGESPLQVFRVSSEGIVDKAGVGISDDLDAGENGLIERVAQIADCGGDDMPSLGRKSAQEPDLESLVAGLRVYINDVGVGFSVEQSVRDRFKFGEIVPCLRD